MTGSCTQPHTSPALHVTSKRTIPVTTQNSISSIPENFMIIATHCTHSHQAMHERCVWEATYILKAININH